MKIRYVYIIIALFCLTCIGLTNYVYSNGGTGIQLKYDPSSSTALPEGPTPSKPNHFLYYKFTLGVYDLADNEYYKIVASLTSSKYKGTMANYGVQTDEDLKFHSSDYVGTNAPLNYWDYGGINLLSKELGSDANARVNPSNIYVRCFDWGAYGKLKVTLYRKNPATGAYDIKVDEQTKTIPRDDNNNGIADRWRWDKYQTHQGPNGVVKGFDPVADDESIAGNNYPGDGWSIYDEYRGLWNGSNHFRLDPYLRDVIITYDMGMQKYAGGDGTIRFHSLHTVDGAYILRAWENIHDHTDAAFLNPVHEDVGWVNFNSQGIPGYKRVWAIRVETRNVHRSNPRVFGNCPLGSPGRITKILIFEGYIRSSMRSTFNDRKAKYSKTKVGFNYTSAELDAAIDTLIRRVVTHEIGHALNLSHPPNDQHDIMYRYILYNVDIINRVIQLFARTFKNTHHLTDWAATGVPAGGPSSNSLAPDPSMIIDINIPSDYTPTPDPPTDPPVEEPTDPPTDPPVEEPTDPPTDPPVEEPTDPPTDPPVEEPTDPPTDPPVEEPTDPPTDQIDPVPPVPPDPPQPVLPDPPTNLRASHRNMSIRLTWTAPSNSGTSSISDYQYRYRIGNSGNWNDWQDCHDISTGETISSLTNGTLYTFQVRTKTNDGVSIASAIASAVPSTIPDAPSNLRAVPYNTRVYLIWDKPDDGGSRITDYHYRYAQSGNSFGAWTSTGDRGTSESISGLTNNVRYKFQVRAVNINGNGSNSNTIYARPIGPPNPPTNLTATPGNGSVALSWRSPIGGPPVNEYYYQYRQGSSGNWTPFTSAGTQLTATVSGLTNGTSYQFQVMATNTSGYSDWAGPVSATPVAPITFPSAPTDFNAIAGYNGHVLLTWGAPTDDGGADITAYRYRYRPQGSYWRSWTNTSLFPSKVEVISGLQNGTTYEFMIRAVNRLGAGYTTGIETATPTFRAFAPSAPRSLSVSNYNVGRVTLRWSAPTNDGGSPITGYEYRADTYNDGSWSNWASTNNGTSTTVRLRGIRTNTEYAFQVRAVNSVGSGSASTKATITSLPDPPVTPTVTVPTSPTNFNLSTHGSIRGAVWLTWTAPSSDGGAPITEYQYSYRRFVSGQWTSYTGWRSIDDTNTREGIRGLTAGTLYEFRVRAVNRIGASSASNTDTARARS